MLRRLRTPHSSLGPFPADLRGPPVSSSCGWDDNVRKWLTCCFYGVGRGLLHPPERQVMARDLSLAGFQALGPLQSRPHPRE